MLEADPGSVEKTRRACDAKVQKALAMAQEKIDKSNISITQKQDVAKTEVFVGDLRAFTDRSFSEWKYDITLNVADCGLSIGGKRGLYCLLLHEMGHAISDFSRILYLQDMLFDEFGGEYMKAIEDFADDFQQMIDPVHCEQQYK